MYFNVFQQRLPVDGKPSFIPVGQVEAKDGASAIKIAYALVPFAAIRRNDLSGFPVVEAA